MSQIGSPSPPLIALLAAGSRTIDVLPHLHRYAIETTGGGCSLLFEHNPRSGALHPTSGYGLDELRVDPWAAEDTEATLIEQAFKRRGPMVVEGIAQQMPDLKLRLGTANALLLPLAQGDDRLGLLAIGFSNLPDLADIGIDSIAVLDMFVTAMELLRLRRHAGLLRDLRELIDEFSASISATLNLTAGLEIFCVGANRLFGADRTSVWVHDRRGRQLALQGSSDPETISRNVRVSADDPLAPAALSMRRSRAEITSNTDEATCIVTVPLRGYRRALGTIVFEGVRIEAGGELELLDRADELGRQLSNAI